MRISSEVPDIYSEQLAAIPDEPSYSYAQGLILNLQRSTETPKRRKELFNYAQQVNLAELSPSFPHQADPLDETKSALEEFYVVSGIPHPPFIEDDNPTLLWKSSEFASAYVLPKIEPAIQTIDVRRLLLVTALEDAGGRTDVIGNGMRANLPLFDTVSSRQYRMIKESLFTASQMLLVKIFEARNISGPVDFLDNRPELTELIQDTSFSQIISNLSLVSLRGLFDIVADAESPEDLLIATDKIVDMNSSEGRRIPVGCPGGSLIYWAPRFLFTACEVVSEAAAKR